MWKNVKRYADDAFTSVIHGKYWHEETRATASQTLHVKGGAYLVVLDRSQASIACDYIRRVGDRAAFMKTFEHASTPTSIRTYTFARRLRESTRCSA